MDLPAIARESLLQHLCSEGLPARLEGDAVVLGLGAATCRCHVGDVVQHPNIFLVSLWFETNLDESRERVVTESLPGMGDTAEEAVVKGAHLWVEGVLPPLRKFLDPGYALPEEQCWPLISQVVGSSEQTRWDVYCGPYQLLGGAGEALLARLEQRPPLAWVMDAVTRYTSQIQPHWVKLFLTRQPDGTVMGEVRFDNVLSEDGYAQLRRFDWPAGAGFAGFRQFLLLIPRETGPPADSNLAQTLASRAQPARSWWQFWRK